MHLWPSMRIRDSFKIAYLKKLEWNLRRMKTQKQSQQTTSSSNDNQQTLLDDNNNSYPENGAVRSISKTSFSSKAVLLCSEILMILSCCYCCFCCGACVAQDEGD